MLPPPPLCRSAQNGVCGVWSISTLHVGPDQTDPRPNPNPLGGSRSARYHCDMKIYALYVLMFFLSCLFFFVLRFSSLSTYLGCWSGYVVHVVSDGIHKNEMLRELQIRGQAFRDDWCKVEPIYFPFFLAASQSWRARSQ